MSSLHPLWGHELLRASLARAALAGTLPQTILLHGPRGAGKQRTALWLAQLNLCTQRTADGPCGECRACRLALKVEHPDLHWYFPVVRPTGTSSPEKLADALEDARGEALVEFRKNPLRSSYSDEARGIYMAAAQSLRRRAQRRPTESDTQVFILGDAEELVSQEASQEAANALLKLLEEPPPSTRIILTSSEPGQLLPTIRSRSLPLHVTPLPESEVERFLTTVGEIDAASAARVARLSQGCIGRALAYLPDEDGEPGPLDRLRHDAFGILEAALASSPADGLRRAVAQRPWGARGLGDLLDSIEEWIRDLAALSAGAEAQVFNVDRVKDLQRLATRLSPDPAWPLQAREVLEQAYTMTRNNVNAQLLVTGVVLQLRRVMLATRAA
jgi:DNA polymerase III subunit delta'